MNEQNLYFDKIDAFLLGHMEAAEAEDFKAEIRLDEELTAQVEARKRLIGAMSESGRREMKLQLKNIHREVIDETPRMRKMNWRPLLAAASIAMIGLMMWWLWMPQSTTSQDIFAANYESYELSLALRDEAPEARVGELNQLYRNKKYAESIPILQELIADEESNDQFGAQLQLALANAFFATGEKGRAIQPLLQIIETEDPFLSDEARWYAALFYIEQNNNQAAIPFLTTLANNSRADHHVEAMKILKSLEQ